MEHEENKEHRLEARHITGHHPDHQRRDKGSSKFVVMAVLLGLLIVVAGMQAVELVNLKSSLSKDITTLAVSGKSSTGSSASSSSALKKNLQNLPQMVGGC